MDKFFLVAQSLCISLSRLYFFQYETYVHCSVQFVIYVSTTSKCINAVYIQFVSQILCPCMEVFKLQLHSQKCHHDHCVRMSL